MTLAQRARQAIESQGGYSYNPKIVDAVCEAGYEGVPDGTTLTTRGAQTLKLQGNAVVVIAGNKIIKSTPVDNDELKDKIVIMYAIIKSRDTTHMGL